MPKLPILRLRSSEPPSLPDLRYHRPVLTFSDLQLGVDNLRYDVFLSSRIIADLSFHLGRYLRRFGNVEDLLGMEVPSQVQPKSSPFIGGGGAAAAKLRQPAGPADLKTVLISIHQAILNRAKAEGNPSIDLLGRLAVLKYIRTELQAQFSRILEQCRTKAKAMEGVRQSSMAQAQERVALFHARKKIVIQKAGQEVFLLLRDIEKETLARTRRSLLGEQPADTYRLFQNPLIFTDEGRDDYICAEHYFMFGNFERDTDRFVILRHLALEFLRELGYGEGVSDEHLEAGIECARKRQRPGGNRQRRRSNSRGPQPDGAP